MVCGGVVYIGMHQQMISESVNGTWALKGEHETGAGEVLVSGTFLFKEPLSPSPHGFALPLEQYLKTTQTQLLQSVDEGRELTNGNRQCKSWTTVNKQATREEFENRWFVVHTTVAYGRVHSRSCCC